MNSVEEFNFIYQKPKKLRYIYIFYLLILLILIYISFTKETMSKYTTNGIVKDNEIISSSVISNVQKISQSSYYKINKKIYKSENFIYSDIYSNGNINIQDIKIENKTKKNNNEIVEITFYYGKDLIIKKIMKGVFG